MLKKLLPYFIILLGASYGFWPMDVIPDVPVVGWIDDIGVFGTAVIIAIRLLISYRKNPDNKSGNK